MTARPVPYSNRPLQGWSLDKRTALSLVTISVAFAVSYVVGIDTLSILDMTGQDGFASQLFYIQTAYWDLPFEFMSLTNVHFFRWLVFLPIISNSENAVIFTDHVIYLFLVAPLIHTLTKRGFWVVALIFVLLPYGVSLRASLVCAGMTYLTVGLLIRPSMPFIFFGGFLCVLSSASVLQALLMLLMFRNKQLKAAKVATGVFLTYCLIVSLQDKIVGVLQNMEGYVSSSSSSGVIANYLERSTLLVSYAEGQSRFYFYAIVTVGLAVLLGWNLFRRSDAASMRRRVLFCAVPGLALEGLGVLSMVAVLVMVSLPNFRRYLKA